jgi:hypothetical protein
MILTGTSRDAEGMVRFSHKHDGSGSGKKDNSLIIECL